MPRGVTKRRPQTVAALLDGALTVFVSKGFGAATVDDITAAAGLTRGAFYSNFHTKEELFFALYEREVFARVAEMASAAASLPADATPTQLAEALVGAHDTDATQWHIVNSEFVLHALRNPDSKRLLLQHRETLINRVASELSRLITTRRLVSPLSFRELAVVLLMARTGHIEMANGLWPNAVPERQSQTTLDIVAELLIRNEASAGPVARDSDGAS